MTEVEFEKLALRMKDKLFRLAVRILGDPFRAEDVVQDVLEKLWRTRSTAEIPQNDEAYLYIMVRNRCIDKTRSSGNKKMSLDTVKAVQDNSAMNYEVKDIRRHIETLMRALPEKQRTVMHLRDIEGETFEQIALITGTDEAAVRMNLSRARKTVREQLTKIMEYGTGKI